MLGKGHCWRKEVSESTVRGEEKGAVWWEIAVYENTFHCLENVCGGDTLKVWSVRPMLKDHAQRWISSIRRAKVNFFLLLGSYSLESLCGNTWVKNYLPYPSRCVCACVRVCIRVCIHVCVCVHLARDINQWQIRETQNDINENKRSQENSDEILVLQS